MRRVNKLPELLAPAGDMSCLYAAVRGGADAIYVGGKSFGARAFAKNFDIDELRLAVRYCHLHGVRLYVTVNTLVYDREMEEVSDYAVKLYEMGVDAVIVADLGVVRELKRRIPSLELHASTQASVHNTEGALAAYEAGCSRVVLARELSLENIISVTEKAPPETEIFLHGALCVCHSGQCLMSSLVGGRSGNRGECAQPCRLPYGTQGKNKYPLSLSDLSLAEHVPKLINSGVASLKIEGRMKAPEYVYEVTSIYRKLLDEGRSANRVELNRLRDAFSRGEFTDSYLTGKPQAKMTGVRSEADKERTRALTPIDLSPLTRGVTASARLLLGELSSLTLSLNGRSVTVLGDAPCEAINHPLTEEGVKERLSKMGGTGLTLSTEDIALTLGEGINLSPGSINSLRRSAALALLSCERESVSEKYLPTRLSRGNDTPLTTALFLDSSRFTEAYSRGIRDRVDIAFTPAHNYVEGSDGIYLPPVVTDAEMASLDKVIEMAKVLGAKYALVGNIGALEVASRHGLIPIGDFRLNITNRGARAYYKDRGIEHVILSPELTLPMARDIGGGEIVYGRIPLMLTERCFIKENFGCEKCGKAALTDRTGAKFPMMREWCHRNLILNSRPTYMGDRKGELHSAGITHAHFIFSIESADEIVRVLNKYEKGEPLGTEVRRIGKR